MPGTVDACIGTIAGTTLALSTGVLCPIANCVATWLPLFATFATPTGPVGMPCSHSAEITAISCALMMPSPLMSPVGPAPEKPEVASARS